MNYKTIKQLEVISELDPRVFQEKFNTFMREHPDAEVQIMNVNGMHTAYITYVYEEEEPETVADQFHIEGIYWHCRNCPEFQPLKKADGTIDRRAKRGKCDYSEYGTANKDIECCELVYKWLMQGKVQPIAD